MLNFLEVLLHKGTFKGQRYFSEAIVEHMGTNQIAELGDFTGLGWELNQPRYMGDYCTPHTFGKTGFTGTLVVCDVEKGFAYVILSNRIHPKRPTNSAAINAFRKNYWKNHFEISMTTQITYFVHGTTTDNEQHISSGWKDVELSELGIQQSKELGETTKDQHFDVVFCSDLKRAHDSAKLAWKGVYQIILDARLRECNYGTLNGASSDVVEPMQEDECIANPFPEGESYEDVKARIADFLEYLKQNYDGTHVAIVAHKAPQLALDVLLKGKTWKQALADDWRKTKAWQPGWEYELK